MTKTNSIFETNEFKPFQQRWDNRLKELSRRKSYYDGSVYKELRGQLGWLYPRLYRGIKPLYMPLARAVDVDAGIVPGAWSLAEDAPAIWQPAIDQVMDWSAWQRDGVLYVHYGAQYGVTGLKVSDLRLQKKVVIKPVKPTCFLLIAAGDYDDTPAMAIYIETRIDQKGEDYEYAEVVTGQHIRTFQDGQPHGFGDRKPEYVNELGFVPYIEAEHIKTGEPWGESTYQKAIPMLDEVNQMASYLADIIAKNAEPQWVVSGAEAGDLVKSGDNVWFVGKEAKVQALVPQVDIPGVLDFIREIRDQVHGALPELSFDELRKKDQIATATLELQLMELVLKVRRCRPNYDHGLVDALRLAGRAAATMGLSEVTVLGDDEALSFDAERSVLPLDPETAMRLELQALALEREKAMAIGEGNGSGGNDQDNVDDEPGEGDDA